MFSVAVCIPKVKYSASNNGDFGCGFQGGINRQSSGVASYRKAAAATCTSLFPSLSPSHLPFLFLSPSSCLTPHLLTHRMSRTPWTKPHTQRALQRIHCVNRLFMVLNGNIKVLIGCFLPSTDTLGRMIRIASSKSRTCTSKGV